MDAAVALEARVIAAVNATADGVDSAVSAVARCVCDARLPVPSTELALTIVSCLRSNVASSPAVWKLLDGALAARIVSPFHTLALLTSSVVPHRRAEPEAYRLYLDLLLRYGFSSLSMEPPHLREEIARSVDESLQLSQSYRVENMDFGLAFALYALTVVLNLIDGILEDWNLKAPSEKTNDALHVSEGYQMMDVDTGEGNLGQRRNEHQEQLRRKNAQVAIDVAEKITANKRVVMSLRLIHRYMPEEFKSVLQRLQIIDAHQSVWQKPTSINYTLLKLLENIRVAVDEEYHLNKRQLLGILLTRREQTCFSPGTFKFPCWIAFDCFMENAMDGRHLYDVSAMEILTELTKTLQVINQASWQETFQALWVSALRLVQRERDPLEGPVPHLDARLCMLLSIVPLSIIPIVKEDQKVLSKVASFEDRLDGDKYVSRRDGLVSSLQVLGQFSGLLSPPPSVIISANDAATRAATFIYNLKGANGNPSSISQMKTSVKAVGSMLHLIVEACIARLLIDTSAYYWPGYVVISSSLNDPTSIPTSPWLYFMEGCQLTSSLKSNLMATPASSIEELNKLYCLALNGSEEEKAASAKILCGASLIRGWNIQEHVVDVVVKLLSPPVPPELADTIRAAHLVSHSTMLNSVLFGISCIDTLHILSMYGMVPSVAAALMPICEAFGSLSPASSDFPAASDETAVYSVFSCAFLFLLRLWKFYRPPQEDTIAGRGGPVRMELTLDYLLLMRNNKLLHQIPSIMKQSSTTKDSQNASLQEPVYINSFPKLHAWYLQNQACIASTLGGLSKKSPVHLIANKILTMICRKMTKVGNIDGKPSSTLSGSFGGSPADSADDVYLMPNHSAWEVLEAIPFVLEAVLAACAYGRLSSRDLTTGLRDLVDYLPASLATIVTYFTAEISRGIWKPVCMNGIDWPSPAANLLSVQSEIKEIVASAGVHVPNCYTSGSTSVMLPLPIAALVSLTITLKLEKSLEYIHGVIGQALDNSAMGFSWPTIPIIGALWSQKVRRWHNFIVASCSKFAFTYDKDAVRELIRSCFSSYVGPAPNSRSEVMRNASVNKLFGHTLFDVGQRSPIAPGLLYLRSCRSFHDIHYVSDMILWLIIEKAHELAANTANCGPRHLQSGHMSLGAAISQVTEVASLGSSLLCAAGGLHLVQVLYEETLPTFLLSTREKNLQGTQPAAYILEGYTMAYMLIISGAFMWGVGKTSASYNPMFTSKRARILGMHMEFIAGVLERNVSLACHPMAWKAYVSCFIGLMVCFMPEWVSEIKQETLKKLATGLCSWHQHELALALLERGGRATIVSVLEAVF